MEPELLSGIGLTIGESKVYLALLRLGETTTGPLAKESNVSASKVYKILDRLTKKGLAGFSYHGKTKYFSAVEPKRILEYLDQEEKSLEEKKQKLTSLLPELELQQNLHEKPQATLFEGFKAVTNVISNILDELLLEETYYVLGATYGETPGLRPFFQKYHEKRAKKRIRVRMIANYETKNHLEKNTTKLAQIKYLPQQFISNLTFYFYKEKVLMVYFTKKPTAILLQGKEAVTNFQAYFNTFWEIAKKD